MPCYSPLTAFKPLGGGPLTFGKEPRNARELKISCGQCIGCRLEKSRQWAMRCTHEAQMHENNCFVTLTYNDENLPEHGSLVKSDLQRFFKRLRWKFNLPIRYYACGEYGDNTQRAHYHACIFGLNFADKTPFRKIGEHTLYISQQLTDVWGLGNTSIGELTFETAAYTARYVTKKLSHGQSRYNRLDAQTGELIPLEQPFALMSLKPAIAKDWLTKYHGDIYNAEKDYLFMRGKRMKPAKYYDKLYDVINPENLAHIKHLREKNHDMLTDSELRVRETITRARTLTKQQI